MSDFDGFGNFDAQQALDENPPKDFGPIPNGWYKTVVLEAAWKNTQSGGRMIVFKAEVIEGQYKGTWSWTNCNLINANPGTVNSARGFIGALSMAIGNRYPKGPQELVGKAVDAKWVVKPEKNNFPAHNEVADWKPIGTMTGTKQPERAATVAVPSATDAPVSGSKKPWEK